MSKLVTILTVSTQLDLALVLPYLEAEGIETFIVDEFAVQVMQYSDALGGIKIQVREEDAAAAIAILIERGYKEEEKEQSEKVIQFFQNTENATNGIPLINKLRVEWRLVSILLLFGGFIALVFYLATKQNIEDSLVQNEWCLDRIEHKGITYKPNTIVEFGIWLSGRCNEKMEFNYGGYMVFPGFTSRAISATYKLDDETMIISNTDTLENVFDGTYKIDVGVKHLVLKSPSTTVYCIKTKN